MNAKIQKRSLLCSLILAILPTAATAQNIGLISPMSGTQDWGALARANGDKVAIGRFNTLHVVWDFEDSIRYSTSASGIPGSWSAATQVAPGFQGTMPTIASDSDGTLVVAFVANPNAAGMGRIRYARKAWGATNWTDVEVVTSGTQPDIEARGGQVYLTWTTLGRIQYTSFPTQSPPAPMALGEVLESTACPNTRFTQPSLALVRENCALVPKVAYLWQSDERNNPNLMCQAPDTRVGPRVKARAANGVWGLEYADFVTQNLPAIGVDSVSLSMDAQYTTGHTFLAWSDTSNGNARTRLAHGQNGVWNAVTFSPTALHAHVAAKAGSTLGDYRLAWVKRDGFIPFVDFDAAFRTGRWASGLSPTWLDPSPTILMGSFGASAGYPQATFWSRCANQSYTTVETVAEAELLPYQPAIQNHYVDQQPCPAGTSVGVNPCLVRLTALVFASRAKTHVDTSELGVPVRFGPGFVEIEFSQGGRKGSATLTWDAGNVVESGPDYFVIDHPAAGVEVAAATHRVELVPLADEYVYDDIETGKTP